VAKIVRLDDIEVRFSDMGKTARSIVKSLEELDAVIVDKENLAVVFQKAHDAYIREIKQEMLRAKAGLEF